MTTESTSKESGPNWSYVTQWENPQATIGAIRKKFGRIDSSPVFYGFWSKTVKYKVALADYEEGLHSLITLDTCTCGLKVNDPENPLAIIESKHHRNHKTLQPDPTPKFRGLVGRRISWPLMGTDQKHEVDVLWDLLAIQSK